MTTIAIMQPYFFPYLGYFRLLSSVDIFVHFDCVQFPRRGYVHRNQMPKHAPTDAAQEKFWLTLPLAAQPQDTRIVDLAFAPDAASEWRRRLETFPWIIAADTADRAELFRLVRSVEDNASVSDYLIETLEFTASLLGLRPRTVRSSSMGLPDSLRGQDRILEVVRLLGGTRYINAPGGRDLYDAADFERRGIELKFLTPFDGRTNSVLYEVCFYPSSALRTQLTS